MHRLDATQYDILYFMAGTVPTKEDYDNLARIEERSRAHRVKFRNGSVGENDSVEKCHGVAGPNVPEKYRQAFPFVDNNGEWSEPQPEPKPSRVPFPVSSKVAQEVGAAPGFSPEPERSGTEPQGAIPGADNNSQNNLFQSQGGFSGFGGGNGSNS